MLWFSSPHVLSNMSETVTHKGGHQTFVMQHWERGKGNREREVPYTRTGQASVLGFAGTRTDPLGLDATSHGVGCGFPHSPALLDSIPHWRNLSFCHISAGGCTNPSRRDSPTNGPDQWPGSQHLFQGQDFLLRLFTQEGYYRKCLAYSNMEQTPHQPLCGNNLNAFPDWEVDIIFYIHKAYVFIREVFVLKLRNYSDSKYLEIKLHYNGRISPPTCRWCDNPTISCSQNIKPFLFF